MSYIKFSSVEVHGNYKRFVGAVDLEEWTNGPKKLRANISLFVSFDDIAPSRYAMGRNPNKVGNDRKSQLAFITLDPSRISPYNDFTTVLDLGDSNAVRPFQFEDQADSSDDDEDDSGRNDCVCPSILSFVRNARVAK